jgi:putative membrane protein
MLEVLAVSLNKTALVGFVVYLIGAVLLFMLFQFVYTRITPHKEFELIRSGNIAAAIALSGAIIGFAIPASNVIAFSVNVLDFVLWAVIAAVVQLLAFLATGLVLKARPSASPMVKSLPVSMSRRSRSASACSTPRA